MTYSNIYPFFIQKRVITTFLVLCAFNLLVADAFSASSEDPKKIWKVVIDPGHGGKDPGALGKTSREKDIVLAVALKLGNYISENFNDVDVIYTRKTDQFIELYRRAEIANKAKADLFISLHTNSWKTTNPVGSETYVMGLHTDEKNLAVAMKENAVITFEEDYTTKYEGYDPESPESFIVFSLMQNTYLEQSLNFASHVQTQFRDRAKRIDRGVKQAGFIVLWNTTMPSVLVEVGFISNPREESYLKSQTGQDYLASAIFRAFREYKLAIESRSDFSRVVDETPSIRFKVQIVASRKRIPLDSEHFSGFENVQEFNVGNVYKYAVGNETSYDDIMKYIQKVKTRYSDSFIIAVQNDKIIPLNEALKEINK
jgi:N-acetylmuramoyl-L-alanine amidase